MWVQVFDSSKSLRRRAMPGSAGFEWMEGIPGSVGGSLRMNAGAMGAETFEQVVSVQVVSSRGEFETLRPSEMQVQYRNVPTLRDRYAVSAIFRGEEASLDAIDRRLMESSHKRKTTQPIAASAGCIFKNPREMPCGEARRRIGVEESPGGRSPRLGSSRKLHRERWRCAFGGNSPVDRVRSNQ